MPRVDSSLFRKPALPIEAKAEQTCLLRLAVKQVPANPTVSSMEIFVLFLFCLFLNRNLWKQSDLICSSKWCIGHKFTGWCTPPKSNLHEVFYSHGYRERHSIMFNLHDLACKSYQDPYLAYKMEM